MEQFLRSSSDNGKSVLHNGRDTRKKEVDDKWNSRTNEKVAAINVKERDIN